MIVIAINVPVWSGSMLIAHCAKNAELCYSKDISVKVLAEDIGI